MVKSAKIFLVTLSLIVGVAHSIQGQTLIFTEHHPQAIAQVSPLYWTQPAGNGHLCLVKERTGLDAAEIAYTLVEGSLTPDRYVWIETRDRSAALSKPDMTVLWQGPHAILAKSATSSRTIQVANAFVKALPLQTYQTPLFHVSHPAPFRKIAAFQASIDSILNRVSLDSLMLTVRQLSGAEAVIIDGVQDTIKSRYSGFGYNMKAQQYLHARFRSMGYEPEIQPFFKATSASSNLNIIAMKDGTEFPLDEHNAYYVICAHYDAVMGTPGADDNASGTAAVLEAARLFKNFDFDYPVKFILFDREEQGLYGSTAYALTAAAARDIILGVINLDMLGWDSDDNGAFEIHSGIYTELGQQLANFAADWTPALAAQHLPYPYSSSSSDHSSFWNVGVPAVLIIEDWDDHNPNYHQAGDTADRLNTPYFHQLARLSIAAVAHLAGVQATESPVETTPEPPHAFTLSPAWPNPFNPRVHMDITLNRQQETRIAVFNTRGQQVATLFQGEIPPGRHRFSWDGRRKDGKRAASGVYLIQVKSAAHLESRKVILTK